MTKKGWVIECHTPKHQKTNLFCELLKGDFDRDDLILALIDLNPNQQETDIPTLLIARVLYEIIYMRLYQKDGWGEAEHLNGLRDH